MLPFLFRSYIPHTLVNTEGCEAAKWSTLRDSLSEGWAGLLFWLALVAGGTVEMVGQISMCQKR